MKIAVFHNLPPGGAKRTYFEQVKYLSKNHEMDIYEYSQADKKSFNPESFCRNVYLYDFSIASKLPGYLSRIDRDIQNFLNLDRFHKKIAGDVNNSDCDVCLVHADKYTQAPFILKHLEKPSVYFCQEYLRIGYEKELAFNDDVVFLKKWYEKMTRMIRKYIDKNNAVRADIILTNSDFTKNNIQKAFGVFGETCHLGVDSNVFRPLRKKKKRNYILFIGEKGSVSGYDFLADVVSNISGEESVEIKILGFSKGKLKISDDRRLAMEYSNATVCVCTSYNEPFGLAPLESMACETPVVAVDEGGYKETIVDGDTGFLLPRDTDVFAEKIEYLYKNPKIAEKIGKAGRKHVIKNFSWEKHGRKVEKVLKSISI